MSENSAAGELRYAVAPITNVEVRDTTANGNDTWTMSGYAAVFNTDTTLLDSKFIRVTESIDPAAFNGVLRDQGMTTPGGVVHFNLNHDMSQAVASTNVPAPQPGSLELSADEHGLRFLARVPKDDPDGVRLAAKMRSGVINQASFAFRVKDAKYDYTERDDGPDEEHRTILDLAHLYDVCACPQGAYSSTTAGLRSYAAALGQSPEGEATLVSPEQGGESSVSPESGGGVSTSSHVSKAAREAFLARSRGALDRIDREHKRKR